MANPGYVRSTDGDNADNGSTWALANATLAAAITDAVAGDTIYVSQVHAETTAGAVLLTFPGSLASPNNVVCANDGAAPPTAVAATATVASTGANPITLNGAAYIYGLTFNCSTGTSGANMSISTADNSHLRASSCVFSIPSTGTTPRFIFGNTTVAVEGSFIGESCTFNFGNVSQAIQPRICKVRLNGGGISGSAVTNLLAPSTVCDFEWVGGDLSSGATAMNLVTTGAASVGRAVFRNCKLPASWSGSVVGGDPANMAFRAEMWNCDSADTNYRMVIRDYSGSILSETTIVRTGGASDGTTTLSWKLASTANAEYPLITLDTPEIVQWNDTTGSAITVTVEIVTDNVTLTDAECWLEVQYLGTSGFPLGSFVNDAKADFLATAANQTSSSVTWTTTGLGTPVKQKMSVTFTPQEKGFIHAVVKLAKASTTVYVCPKLDVT